MKFVRFGIIGLGGIAKKFAGAISLAGGVELAAVASREQARSDSFAAEFGASRAYGNYDELIADPDVDVIYIALTHNFHYAVARRCVEAGKPVICEKPFFTNRREAEELVSLARDRKVLMMEAMWTRCLPAFRQAKAWADAGRIGEIKLIQASFSFNATKFGPTHRLFDPALAGGSLWDAGVYPIEFATGIMGCPPTSVKGVATFGETGVDTYVAMSFGFPGGVLASLSCGLTAATSQDAAINGTEGRIVAISFLGSRRTELYDQQNRLVDSFEEKFDNGFEYQIRHMADLFRTGQLESPWIPLQDTVDCAGIFDSLRAQF